jgi:hypothetical protein
VQADTNPQPPQPTEPALITLPPNQIPVPQHGPVPPEPPIYHLGKTLARCGLPSCVCQHQKTRCRFAS